MLKPSIDPPSYSEEDGVEDKTEEAEDGEGGEDGEEDEDVEMVQEDEGVIQEEALGQLGPGMSVTNVEKRSI